MAYRFVDIDASHPIQDLVIDPEHHPPHSRSETTNPTASHTTDFANTTSYAGHNLTSTSSDTKNDDSTAAEEYESDEKRHDSDKLTDDDEPTFIPIRAGDRAQLHRLASTMSTTDRNSYISHNRDSYHAESSLRPSASRIASTQPDENVDLERKDTLYGVEFGDPVLDPASDKFDSYKWARMLVRTMDEEGVKRRRAGFIFKDLNVAGSGAALQLQKNVGSLFLAPARLNEYVSFGHKAEKQILRNFDGVLKSSEMLIVLGRPGSGCSTFLKTIAGELHGLNFDKKSTVHYNGISQKQMLKEYRGEVVYNQEVDKHFPHLTVGETLEFAAAARTPHHRVKDASRAQYSKHMAQVMMALFGLSHTYNTKVGDDFVRGVSGGERKRVSIAEMALAGAPIACWDNSTRGLDAATALEFTKSLKMSANLSGACHAVAIYQASQAIYDIFDKAIVLYEGREIYYGPCKRAEKYFHDMGWKNPSRQTVADFLTSVTNPAERKTRDGFDKKVPRTPDEFEKYWKNSEEFKNLQREIQAHEEEYPVGGHLLGEFQESKRGQQAKHVRAKSPYIISIPMQIRLCTKRAYQRLWNDKTSTLTTIIGQIAMALIIGSVFFNTPQASAGFFAFGSVLFFAVLREFIRVNPLTISTNVNPYSQCSHLNI